MHAHFIQDLAVIMLVAGIITVLFHRLRAGFADVV